MTVLSIKMDLVFLLEMVNYLVELFNILGYLNAYRAQLSRAT